MKIGILTFVRSMNYGSFLQCYSLYKKLSSIPGVDVEVINYNTFNAELGFILLALSRGVSGGYRQYEVFRESRNKNLPTSNRVLTNDYKKIEQYINSRKYDCLVVGSDEVWKLDRFRKYPNIYFKISGINCYKLSYAASANRTDIELMDKTVKADISREFSSFDFIGVRDRHTSNFIEQLNISTKPVINCDPTFYFVEKEIPDLVRKIEGKYGIDFSKPMIGLLSNNPIIGSILKKNYGSKYQIVALTCNNKYADAWLNELDPFEWAAIFKYFSIVVTTYFHGTVFAILNYKPFISIDYEKYSLYYETKIKDILRKANMLDNYCNIVMPDFKEEDFLGIFAEQISADAVEHLKYSQFIEHERKKISSFEEVLKKLVSAKAEG